MHDKAEDCIWNAQDRCARLPSVLHLSVSDTILCLILSCIRRYVIGHSKPPTFREATGLTQGLLNRIAEFLIDLLDRSRGKLLRWLFPAIHAPSEHRVSLVLAEDR
jgi:hypothetical protein